MKRLFIIMLMALAVVSCSKDNSGIDHDQSQEQAALNEILDELEQRFDEVDRVTSIVEIVEVDEVVGYTVSFANSAPLTIYSIIGGKEVTVEDEDGVAVITVDTTSFYFDYDFTIEITVPESISSINSFIEISGLPDYDDISVTLTDNNGWSGSCGTESDADAEGWDVAFIRDNTSIIGIVIAPKSYTNDSPITGGDIYLNVEVSGSLPIAKHVEFTYSVDRVESYSIDNYPLYTNVWIVDATDAKDVVSTLGSDGALGQIDPDRKIQLSIFGAEMLENDTFKACKSLSSIYSPDTKKVGGWVFYDCYSLSSISLPEAEFIDCEAMRNCYGLTELSLSKVSHIGEYAFAGCPDLKRVYLPAAQYISDYAFYFSQHMTTVELGNGADNETGVKFLGHSVFAGVVDLGYKGVLDDCDLIINYTYIKFPEENESVLILINGSNIKTEFCSGYWELYRFKSITAQRK